MGIFTKDPGENKKYLKPPPRNPNIAFKIHLSVTFRRKHVWFHAGFSTKYSAHSGCHTQVKNYLTCHTCNVLIWKNRLLIPWGSAKALEKHWTSWRFYPKPLITMNTVNCLPNVNRAFGKPAENACHVSRTLGTEWHIIARLDVLSSKLGNKTHKWRVERKNHQFWFVGSWLS